MSTSTYIGFNGDKINYVLLESSTKTLEGTELKQIYYKDKDRIANATLQIKNGVSTLLNTKLENQSNELEKILSVRNIEGKFLFHTTNATFGNHDIYNIIKNFNDSTSNELITMINTPLSMFCKILFEQEVCNGRDNYHNSNLGERCNFSGSVVSGKLKRNLLYIPSRLPPEQLYHFGYLLKKVSIQHALTDGGKTLNMYHHNQIYIENTPNHAGEIKEKIFVAKYGHRDDRSNDKALKLQRPKEAKHSYQYDERFAFNSKSKRLLSDEDIKERMIRSVLKHSPILKANNKPPLLTEVLYNYSEQPFENIVAIICVQNDKIFNSEEEAYLYYSKYNYNLNRVRTLDDSVDKPIIIIVRIKSIDGGTIDKMITVDTELNDDIDPCYQRRIVHKTNLKAVLTDIPNDYCLMVNKDKYREVFKNYEYFNASNFDNLSAPITFGAVLDSMNSPDVLILNPPLNFV